MSLKLMYQQQRNQSLPCFSHELLCGSLTVANWINEQHNPHQVIVSIVVLQMDVRPNLQRDK